MPKKKWGQKLSKTILLRIARCRNGLSKEKKTIMNIDQFVVYRRYLLSPLNNSHSIYSPLMFDSKPFSLVSFFLCVYLFLLPADCFPLLFFTNYDAQTHTLDKKKYVIYINVIFSFRFFLFICRRVRTQTRFNIKLNTKPKLLNVYEIERVCYCIQKSMR